MRILYDLLWRNIMKEYTIGSNDAGQRVDKFILKVAKQLPKSMLYKMIRKKRIKRNGKRCDAADQLVEGDLLQLYINDEFFGEQKESVIFNPLRREFDIVYEDQNILLVNKPIGLRVHGDQGETENTLVHQVQQYLIEKGDYCPEQEQSFSPALCNRLDRNTQGIVIAAKNAASLRMLNQKIQERQIQKYYLCMVTGVPKPEHQLLVGYWKKNQKNNLVTISPQPVPDGKKVITEYTVQKQNGEYSLLEIQLHTGRSHQIRAHMASTGHPLVGDVKYGGEKQKGYQCLCAYKLKFQFDTDAGILNYLNQQEFSLKQVWFKDQLS